MKVIKFQSVKIKIVFLLSHCFTVYSLPKIAHIKHITTWYAYMIKNVQKRVCYIFSILFEVYIFEASENCQKKHHLTTQHPVRNQLNFL
jgi:hypothetical protein